MRTSPIAALLSIAFSASAATFHVAPPSAGGSDANPGTAEQPFATIQRAANSAFPGDTVLIAPGTYTGFNVVRSGQPGLPVTFSAEPGVVIDAAAAPFNGGNHRSRINLDTVSHIVIEGFEVVGTNDLRNSAEGIRVVAPLAAGAGHITIRNNHAHHNGNRNIFTGFVSNLTIEGNTCHNAHKEHGIYISNSADNHVVRGNIVYDNAGAGLHVNADASLGGDGVITNVLVEANIFHGNGAGGTYIDTAGNPQASPGGGSAVNFDGVRNSTVVNNLLYDNHASGVSLYRIDGGQPSSFNVVVNNTIVNAPDARWCVNIRDGSTDNAAFNNVLINRNTARGAISITANSLTGFRSDHNIVSDRFDLGGSFITLAQWRTQTGQDLASIPRSPTHLPALFTSPATGGYTLAPNSDAIDAGVGQFDEAAAPTSDLLGLPRPQGVGHDIGAYESPVCALIGDIDGDGDVDFADLNALLGAFNSAAGGPGYLPGADLDQDGHVDFADLNTLLSHFNARCP
ncbi:MAG: right-handed parallel beta-helix repeat-containing protein [Phycisphaerales bacterium]|nr:right-handed parallel beta-helix repeat-containing protein [Phycisphaerales bacterium]